MIRDDNVQTIANWTLYTIFFFCKTFAGKPIYLVDIYI